MSVRDGTVTACLVPLVLVLVAALLGVPTLVVIANDMMPEDERGGTIAVLVLAAVCLVAGVGGLLMLGYHRLPRAAAPLPVPVTRVEL